jgi:hypothetical protein
MTRADGLPDLQIVLHNKIENPDIFFSQGRFFQLDTPPKFIALITKKYKSQIRGGSISISVISKGLVTAFVDSFVPVLANIYGLFA